MKTMFPPSYHHNGFVATYAIVHHVPKYMSCHRAFVVITERAHCFHEYTDYMYIKYNSNYENKSLLSIFLTQKILTTILK